MSNITINYEGNSYTLGFNRRTTQMLEQRGFSLKDISERPNVMVPLLFEGALQQRHRNLKKELVDEIYDEIPNKSELLEVLIEMYAEVTNSLMDDNVEGNATWERGK